MNEEARDFLNKLDYPFARSPTLVVLRTPREYRSLVDHLSREFTIDAQQLQAGDEFLVAFVRTADEIKRTITRYAHRIGENGKFWFISNRLSLLSDDNLFLALTNAQFESDTPLVRLKYDYQAKLFQLKDQISKIVVDRRLSEHREKREGCCSRRMWNTIVHANGKLDESLIPRRFLVRRFERISGEARNNKSIAHHSTRDTSIRSLMCLSNFSLIKKIIDLFFVHCSLSRSLISSLDVTSAIIQWETLDDNGDCSRMLRNETKYFKVKEETRQQTHQQNRFSFLPSTLLPREGIVFSRLLLFPCRSSNMQGWTFITTERLR